MPRWPDKPKIEEVIHAGWKLPAREVSVVERVVGKVRSAVQIGTSFFYWPLWQRYPTIDQYHDSLKQERLDAINEGRKPHRAALPPIGSRRGRAIARARNSRWPEANYSKWYWRKPTDPGSESDE